MALRAGLLAFALALLTACSPSEGANDAASPQPKASALATPAPADPASDTTPEPTVRNVLVLGDSLSAAYNLAAEQGWVALLDARMRAETPGYRMINASISGETTAGGAARIDAAITEHQPALVVLALGANDGLRGLSLDETRTNLIRIVRAAKRVDAQVLVIGMRLPPNYGPDYTEDFFTLFSEIAQAEGAAHLPFLLEPIALDEAAFQADRLHPTAEVQPALADHVWKALEPLLAPQHYTVNH